MSERVNVSSDLIWEVARSQNAYLVKRKTGGGAQFSRDPFNLTNKHSKTHAGFANDKAVSVQPSEKGGVHLLTKTSKNSHQPAKHNHSSHFGPQTSNQKLFKSVSSGVGKNSYRSDLNQDAVKRASAIRLSQKEKKDTPAPKLRGSKAKKAEA